MIGTHLPRGTKIVCIVNKTLPEFEGLQPKFMQEYTLDGYVESREHGFNCYLAEEPGISKRFGIRYAYALFAFDVVQKLPAETEITTKEFA